MFTRRSFLATTASLIATRSLFSAKELKFDIAIIGGGLGGVAAALAAARHGCRVLMTEETDWIGGQLTSQAVPPDEHQWVETYGVTKSYREFRDGVRAFYRDHYPLTDKARGNKLLNPGGGNVSRLCHEPRVALAVLEAMLAQYVSTGRVVILRETVTVKADTQGDIVKSVTVRDLRSGREQSIEATYFLDATELGDLLPLTGTEFVTGFESNKVTGEPHAPAEAQPANQQAFTYCFAVDYIQGEDHVIDKPAEYDFWRNYVPKMTPAWPGKLLSWSMSDPITLKERKVFFDPTLNATGPGLNLFAYRRIASKNNFVEGTYRSDISLVNWPQNDYWLGNLVGVKPDEAEKHKSRGKQLSLSLLYWMQTDAPRPDGGAGWKGLRLRNDVVGTADGLAKYPYIRESRRIVPEVRVLEQHVSAEIRKQNGQPKAETYTDTVGIGSYRIDLHPSTGGDNYIDVASMPFQIPMGALLPVRVNNLIPACKNIGTTHITNGCYRLHPVEWNIGEAAGALAAWCVKNKKVPREVRKDGLADFQKALRDDGVELEWKA